MLHGLKGEIEADRNMIDVDVNKEECFLDTNETLAACASNGNGANITIFPIQGRPKFGLRQPKLKAPGGSVSALGFSPYDPYLVFVGTENGNLSTFRVPEKGLKGDVSKPLTTIDTKNEIKAMTFHPIAKNLVAVGLRNGHIQLYDETLSAPLFDIEGQRALNSIAFSYDGTKLYALYIDMVLRVWDIRGNNSLAEKKVCASRGVGILTALPDGRICYSTVEGGKQIMKVFDEELNELNTRTFENKPNPLRPTYHFSGVIFAHATKTTKVYILNTDLTDICVVNSPDVVVGAMLEKERPDPDSNIFAHFTLALSGNQVRHGRFYVSDSDKPIKFGSMPIYETDFDAKAWASGENGERKTEKLEATIQEEVVEEEEKEEEKKIITRYRFLNAESCPPNSFYTQLPVGIVPNPEFNEIVTNGEQFAFIGAGNPSPIRILPLDHPFRYPTDYPGIVDPHKGAVSYLEFSPHSPQTLMSAGEDGKIKLWELPKGELKKDITDSVLTLQMLRRVGVAKFSEACRNLVMAVSAMPELVLWDLNRESKARDFSSLMHTQAQDAAWNAMSSGIYVIYKDGKFINFDPRDPTPSMIAEGTAHVGIRHRRILDLPDYNRVATFGGGKHGQRECSIWDPRSFSQPLKTVEFDTSSGAMLPMYEEGSGVIYCGGKGDGHIRFIELCDDDRIVAATGCYDTTDPERGLCLVPRRLLNVMSVEVSRMLKLSTESLRTLHWRTPRTRSDLFQDDIFGPSRDTSAALMEVVDWEDKQDDMFPTLRIQPEGTKKASEVVVEKKVTKRVGGPLHEEKEDLRTKKITIDEIVAMAPQISTESSSSDEEDSESW